MVPSLLAGAAAAALAGLLVGIPSLRLKGDYLAIVTLGFSEIIRVIILNIPAVGGATGFTDAIPITNFFWIFSMAILTIVITRNIAMSTFGRALFAIRSDEIAAEAMGINTTRYKVMAFVISAALAGVAGGLSGQLFANPLNPQNLNFVKSIEVDRHDRARRHRVDHRGGPRRDDSDDPARGAADVRSAVPWLADGHLRAAADSSDDLPAAGPAGPPRVLRGPGCGPPSGGPYWLIRRGHLRKTKKWGLTPFCGRANVTMRFGGLTAVKSLTMTVPRQSLYGLIGPNGAGKTTVFNVLTGVYCPTEGEIEFDGTHIEKKKPYEITRLGAARTFQNIRLFADMTVLQNVMTAHHLRIAPAACLMRCSARGRHHVEERETRERAHGSC